MPLHTPVHADLLAAYPRDTSQPGANVMPRLRLSSSPLGWIDPSLPAEITSQAEARGFFEAAWQGFPDLAFTAVG
jgi:hypothetical protein